MPDPSPAAIATAPGVDPVRRALPLLLCAILAGCGAGTGTAPADGPKSGVAPERVVLYEDTVTVEMSDRSFCTGPRGRQGRDWSGRLQGCPAPWPFRAVLPAARVARLPLAPGEGGAGRVELTLPDGVTQVWTGPR